MLVIELVLVLIGVVFLLVGSFRAKEDPRTGQTRYVWRPVGTFVGAVVLILLATLGRGVGQVEAGNCGIVLRFGAVTGRTLAEGIYFVNPFVESVEIMSIRTEAFRASKAEAASRDLQVVHTDITVNYSVDRNRCGAVFQRIGNKEIFEAKVIAPAVQESLKASTAQFKAEELITRRPFVQESIAEHLTQRLGPRGFIVEAVSITDFGFSEEFNRAIEAKVTATQEALRAEQVLRRVKFEAQQQIERAKAEAEALRIQKQNVTAQLIELRRIEAQMKAIEKWDGRMPQVVTGSGPVPLLDVFKPGENRPAP